MMTLNRASVRYITAFMYLFFLTIVSGLLGALPNTDAVRVDENTGLDLILLTEAVFRNDITEAERYANILSLYTHSISQNYDDIRVNLIHAQLDDRINVTLAHWAAKISLDILRGLESTGVNLSNITRTDDAMGFTLLHSAVLGNNLRVVKYLVEEKRFDVEAECGSHQTPLAYAVRNVKSIAIVKYLVDERKADLNWRRPNLDINLLHIAAGASNLVALKYLVDEKNMSAYLEDSDFFDNSVAMTAVSEGGDLDVLKYLIEEKHVNTSRKNFFTNYNLLHFAADSFNLPIVKYLVEKHNFDIMEPVTTERSSTLYTLVKRWFLPKNERNLGYSHQDPQKGQEVLAYLKKRMVDKLKGV